MLRRAGVAIVLIATLMLPYGACQPPVRGNAHECCVHSVPQASVKADCCIMRGELPAVLDHPVVTAAPAATDAWLELPAGPAVVVATSPAHVLAHPSPPHRKSVLRI